MLLRTLVADGLVGGPLAVEPEGRVARVPDAARAAEVLEFAAAALDPERLPQLVARYDLGPASAVAATDGAPELRGLDPVAVGRVFEPGRRTVTIELSLTLDPTLFARLREQAGREPRIGPALAAGSPLVVKVGWWWSRAHDAGEPSVLAVRLGDLSFETNGKDRLPFLGELFPDLARRLRSTDPFQSPSDLAERLVRAAHSPSPAARAGWAAVRAAAAAPPFGLPSPELVSVAGRSELRFGSGLASARRGGREAVDALRWLAAIHVDSPDVLLVPEAVPEAVLASWRRALEAPDAPIEQVLVG